MKIETLKKDNKKRLLIGGFIAITLIITITFIGTRAKYKTTNNIPIAKGIIRYNYDMELIAVKLENDEGKYDSSDNIPTSGYVLNTEKSICKEGDAKQGVTITYENGKINVLGLSKKGTKCEVYFDRGLILANNTIDTSRATGPFNEAYNEDTSGKIFSAEDDDGTTYFFAGSNPNNWVKFGTNKEGQDLYWRIIRINGNGSIRIIYNGPTTDQTGETTQIGTSAFNTNYDDSKYVGYMYDSNKTSSTIKEYIDTWYEENLKTDYGSYIDTNAGFCGDRSLYSGTGIGTEITNYVTHNRVYDTFTPTYNCPNQANDLYTLEGSSEGNKALKNPIGLITVDEAYYAGGVKGVRNQSFWLCTKYFYWTMSPSYFNGNYAFEFGMYDNGYFFDGGYVGYNNDDAGVRPVINLKKDALTTGKGTTLEPYKIS